jgi:hypothetical protein
MKGNCNISLSPSAPSTLPLKMSLLGLLCSRRQIKVSRTKIHTLDTLSELTCLTSGLRILFKSKERDTSVENVANRAKIAQERSVPSEGWNCLQSVSIRCGGNSGKTTISVRIFFQSGRRCNLGSARFEFYTAVTMKNAAFWDTRTKFVLHRKHITSPLQSPASYRHVRFEFYTAVTKKNAAL